MEIRSATPDDAHRLLEIYAYYVVNTAISCEYDVPSEAEFRSRIEHTLQKYPYLVLEEDGIIQGYAYAGIFKVRAAYARSCEVSIYVDHAVKRRGYGRKLYEVLEERLKTPLSRDRVSSTLFPYISVKLSLSRSYFIPM